MTDNPQREELARLETELRQAADGRFRAALQAEEDEPNLSHYRKGYGRGLLNTADRIAELLAGWRPSVPDAGAVNMHETPTVPRHQLPMTPAPQPDPVPRGGGEAISSAELLRRTEHAKDAIADRGGGRGA